MGGVLGGLFIGIGVALFLGLLRAAASRPAPRDPETGDLVLQCSPTLVWTLGLLAAGGPILMGFLSMIIPFEHPNQVFVPIGVGAFFLLLGGSMCLWAIYRRTRVGEDGLTSEYVLFAQQFLRWDEVQSVDFTSGVELWVRGPRGRKAMLMTWFVGVHEAVPYLRRCLPEGVKGRSAVEAFAITVGVPGRAPLAPPRKKPLGGDDRLKR
jgi:hypothetical protein